jgi:acetyl esterase/lipase
MIGEKNYVWLLTLYLFVGQCPALALASAPADNSATENSGTAVPPGAPAAPGYKTSADVLAAIGLKQIKLIAPLTNLPAGVMELKDLEYGKVGERSLRLDLFRPEKPAKAVPGLIFIHGGGWSGGDRKMLRYYAIGYAQKGYVTVCISYRLSDEAPFPAAVEDSKCAVRWLRDNASTYGIDPEKIGVIGGSAGGHLAMMVGYAPDIAELEGHGGHAKASCRVQAVVDFYGVYDLTTPLMRKARPVEKFLGSQSYDDAPELYVRASPSHYLSKKAPPTLILHGTIDDLVPISQADSLAARLKELDVPYVYDRLAGWPHAMDLAEVVNVRCQFFMDNFFAKYLPLPK